MDASQRKGEHTVTFNRFPHFNTGCPIIGCTSRFMASKQSNLHHRLSFFYESYVHHNKPKYRQKDIMMSFFLLDSRE